MNTEMHSTFVNILDNMSGRATNKAMKQELGWSDADYLMVRGELIKAGTIKLGRCRGGMVAFKEPLKENDDKQLEGAASGLVHDPFPEEWRTLD